MLFDFWWGGRVLLGGVCFGINPLPGLQLNYLPDMKPRPVFVAGNRYGGWGNRGSSIQQCGSGHAFSTIEKIEDNNNQEWAQETGGKK